MLCRLFCLLVVAVVVIPQCLEFRVAEGGELGKLEAGEGGGGTEGLHSGQDVRRRDMTRRGRGSFVNSLVV